MAVAFEPVSMINGEAIYSVLTNPKRIRELARMLVVSQAEGHIDMIQDMPGEYTSFTEVSNCMSNAVESTQDYISDLLGEFEEELRAAVAQVQVTTRNATFDEKGLKDCEVYVC
jgi:hypothetical protein